MLDIGIDQSLEIFLNKINELNSNIVGMRGVLTLALEAMKDTIDGLKEAGLREDVKVIIGGEPVRK